MPRKSDWRHQRTLPVMGDAEQLPLPLPPLTVAAPEPLPKWMEPIASYIQWQLLRGRTPEEIRATLRDSNRYPDLTATEWDRCYAIGLSDCRATIAGRAADPTTEVHTLWQARQQEGHQSPNRSELSPAPDKPSRPE